MQKWSAYIKGDPKRQEVLKEALEWVSSAEGITVDAYLAKHRWDAQITGLKNYFVPVIDWIDGVFTRPPDKEMRGLDWGRLYESHHSTSYDAAAIYGDIDALRADPEVFNNKGIYEYLLGGKTDHKLLDIRLFDKKTKVAAYEQQTQKAKTNGESNCPLCALGTDANQTRIYKPDEMDADHVTAWSNNGQSTLANCQMLCVTHNRAKGNR
jgi:hypothetical protein